MPDMHSPADNKITCWLESIAGICLSTTSDMTAPEQDLNWKFRDALSPSRPSELMIYGYE